MKKGFIIAGVVLVSVGLLVFLGALFASGFDLSNLSSAKYETNTHPVNGDFETIDVTSFEANIEIITSGVTEPRVECVEHEKVKHEVKLENGVLKIVAVDNRTWIDHLNFFSFKPQSVKIYLPKKQYRILKASSGTGDILVPESASFRGTEITSGTGNITFNPSDTGEVRITTSTGDISASRVHAHEIRLSTSTGKIELLDVSTDGPLFAKVSTGRIKLTNVKCKTFESEGSTGDLFMKNTVAADFFDIRRNTGDVEFDDCDAGTITVKTSFGNVTGTLRSNKVFIAKSSTGKIEVPTSVTGGKCEITTTTGDIKISFVPKLPS